MRVERLKTVSRNLCFLLFAFCFVFIVSGCGGDGEPGLEPGAGLPSGPSVGASLPVPSGSPSAGESGDAWRIRVVDTAGAELWSFTESELMALPDGQDGVFAHVFSTINNWPTVRFYAVEGYSVIRILQAAGVYDTVQTVTFRSHDGYEIGLTREQLLRPQFYYPDAGEGDRGSVQVQPVIAYRWRAGSDDMAEVRDDDPALIIGQRNPFEQTNPAFVEGVAEIVVDFSPSESWQMAGTFPMPGPIAADDTVKLQHQFFGLVKLHYTLDGSDPTPLSQVYNPSTFRPELTVPIPIIEPTTIKVLVTGFGRNDSEIAVFEFWPAGG